jgi:hypothetical protein
MGGKLMGAEDVEAIRYLQAIYSLYVDDRRYDELGELLSDAVFRLTWEAEGIETGEIRGAEAIIDYYREHQRDRRPSRHVITNEAIDVAEDGQSAVAYSYLTSVGYPPDREPPTVLLSGHYEDRFQKIDGRWRFTQKYCVMDLPS